MITKKSNIFGLILILIFSCNSQNTNKDIQKDEKIKSLSEKEVILTETEWNSWLKKQYGFELWEPDSNDIEKVKLLIRKAIQNNEFDFIKEPIEKNLNSYYRQYIPYVNNKGERIIEVNAFCEILKIPPHPESASNEWTKQDWKNKIVIVDDGGSCYWQMKVNLETDEYLDLYLNGHG